MGLHLVMIRCELVLLVCVPLCSLACKPGWKGFGVSCYQEFEETYHINQRYAKTLCKNKGGDLVSITTLEEDAFIRDQVMNRRQDSSFSFPWIGLVVDGSTGVTTWTDGSPFPQHVYDFQRSPHLLNDTSTQCGQIDIAMSISVGWTLEPCDYVASTRYICEVAETDTTTMVPTTTTTPAPTTVPTTTTTVPTTTTPACLSDYAYRTLIREAGNKLHRTYNAILRYHQYDTRRTPDERIGHKYDGNLGYYVNKSETYLRLATCCPKLIAKMLLEHDSEPCVDVIEDVNGPWYLSQREKGEMFFCAPSKNYCGANFELVEINKRYAILPDNFYPKSDYERKWALKQLEYKDKITRTVCWIWQ